MADDTTPQSLCATPEPLYAIADVLSRWGMKDWLVVLTGWLARYHHGIQALLLHRDEHPAEQVLELLLSLPARPGDDELAHRLARLDFLLWRIARPDEAARRWNPLEQTLCQYLDGDPPVAWSWDSEYPAAPETEAWLLAELARARGAPP